MLWTALTLGVFGSLHCFGMCGPIALALPYQNQSKWQAISKILLYNFGRITTYILLGIVIGLVSKGVFLANMQTYVSIGLGVALLIIALFSIKIETKLLQSRLFGRWYLQLKVRLGLLLKSNTHPTFYKIGLLNGFLPCGLVYMAIVGAITMNDVGKSVLYMAFFGLGTVPLMLATAIAGQVFSFKFRQRLTKLYPVFFVLFAVLLIMRGLRFEIPETMEFWESWQHSINCF